MKYIRCSELLKDGEKQCIITDADISIFMLSRERELILKKHPNEIFIGSDGRVKTYLPDPTKESGRRLVARATIDKIQDAIIVNYFELRAKGIDIYEGIENQIYDKKKLR